MKRFYRRLLVASIIAGVGLCGAMAATAQTTASTTQRDVKQQQRIEQGLKSGQLSTAEAARLERGQAQVDRLQAHVLRDGSLSAAEQARLSAAQNHQSRAIHAERHDGVSGNPQSRSSRRMQRDVARNVHQQSRIEHGVQSGALTAHETARLEGRQAHAAQVEQRAARDGHVGPHEQRHIQRVDQRDSRSIYRKKHNGRVVG
ncbi:MULTISPECIES: hypothetical protein [Rhodanobacter]|uniref:hypothetical protein n=1 Tax=Rhodanobacter TaxID=75309 RepID=UPI0004066AEB|nr:MULTISPECIES: hypothetical protein [Rhodanobacter]KZC19256.1 hypothetical protein RHOFW104R3_32215 [Rhodanobacter denitrificans]UJJ52179.1 hypothetical protein LRK52_05675 [Rhodanobacter denitrificans]UJM94926.1 hypothetical protein LRK32_05675 [Rhodanobacter denitrificans]UJM98456.1 hypothetical protein LRK44_05680 [Rhodanobacter denitrificans]UJN22131.1 hypothetical protein LRK54_02815 [Rhodanobacter denitrificans]